MQIWRFGIRQTCSESRWCVFPGVSMTARSRFLRCCNMTNIILGSWMFEEKKKVEVEINRKGASFRPRQEDRNKEEGVGFVCLLVA